jgi:NADH-quinone oxidoreductase subunit E
MLFTLEIVSCLGACGLAPVMVINEDVHGQMTPEKALKFIDEIIANEKGAAK